MCFLIQMLINTSIERERETMFSQEHVIHTRTRALYTCVCDRARLSLSLSLSSRFLFSLSLSQEHVSVFLPLKNTSLSISWSLSLSLSRGHSRKRGSRTLSKKHVASFSVAPVFLIGEFQINTISVLRHHGEHYSVKLCACCATCTQFLGVFHEVLVNETRRPPRVEPVCSVP